MVSAAEFDDADTSRLRVPPHSIEAEQSLLGGLMLDNSAWDRIADVVSAEDFYRPDHRLIFAAMGQLVEQRQPCDAVTVSELLDRRGEAEQAGGLAYLAQLANETPSAANVKAYASILRERSVLRSLIEAGNEMVTNALTPEGRNATELLDEAERAVFQIAEQGNRGGGFQELSKVLPGVVDRIDQVNANQGEIAGISTGFKEFDKRTSGLQRGDLIIIAGRPSMGKTTLAINIAENAAFGRKLPVAVYSMEMSAEQLALRMVSSLGSVDQSKLRSGPFAPDEWNRIGGAIQQMQEAPIHIDETPAMTPTEVRARARRLKREHGDLGLIVVDYLQLMQVPGTKENRTNEISEISRSLKALARELNCPVIALSQLNRSVEQRTDKKPVMSDLRESGAIEQDADLICFIYREEVYNPDTPRKGVADIIISKQRNGPIGEFPLTF
ncbi:MAG: replicative DNA helicase, partial [Pseudomonadota bacterium]